VGSNLPGLRVALAQMSKPPISAISSDAPEIALIGGRLTLGVVRVGDTVRRPSKTSSRFVAALLEYLERQGCSWAPRYLGRDSSGRDVLSYLPGHVPAKWRKFRDDQLRAAAAILRALHGATDRSVLAPNGVVCHHDPGPNNFVFRDDVPVALIDFDTAAAGAALEDLGYMAWSWCLSSNPLRGPFSVQARQVRILADAYGASERQRAQLPDAILERLERNVRFWSDRLEHPGDILTAAEKLPELAAWSKRELQFIEAQRAALARAME